MNESLESKLEENISSISTELELVSSIKGAIASLEPDVQSRNLYMNRRDWYTYSEGLWEQIEIEDGFDRTLYNFLPRVVDIHTAQLMGQPFQIYSQYEKEDLSIYQPGDPQLEMAKMRNKRAKSDADQRKKLIDAIIRDNGGHEIFKEGARIGSCYGTTVYKMWWDPKTNKICINVLESPQNYRAGWKDTNFRDRDYDAYVYRISYSDARRQYSHYLKPGEDFESSTTGDPLATGTQNQTADPLDQNQFSAQLQYQTYREMVTVVDFTGYLDGWKTEGKNIVSCERGDETKISLLVVGGHVVSKITNEDRMPKYYIINNQFVPRRAWGAADLPDSALEINATYIERMADYITLANKSLFPMVMAKGFEGTSIPKKKQRKMSVVPMALDQTLEAVKLPTEFGVEYPRILQELKDAFVKVTGVGQVLFNDPQQVSDSNQALMTSLKGVIDVAEDKHTRWEPVIGQMFTDALHLASKYLKPVQDVVDTDDNWYLYMRWPNVLRKEDPSYQTMYHNRLIAGAISLDSYFEAMGVEDPTEEVNRLRDNMSDPITAAILGRGLTEMASMTIKKAEGIPPWGYVIPHVTLKGDLSPQQEGNMAQEFGWGDGPFGNAMGPQGNSGQRADDNFVNQGQVQGNKPDSYGMPSSITPGQPLTPNVSQTGGAPMPGGQPAAPAGAGPAPGPTLTPGENQGPQPVSQPGSGMPTPTSAQGAIKKHHQRSGG